MVKRRSTRRSRPRKLSLHKPNGGLGERVQKVGPQHFAIVCVDVAKKRSKWMMSDFYGKVLVEPNLVIPDALPAGRGIPYASGAPEIARDNMSPRRLARQVQKFGKLKACEPPHPFFHLVRRRMRRTR